MIQIKRIVLRVYFVPMLSPYKVFGILPYTTWNKTIVTFLEIVWLTSRRFCYSVKSERGACQFGPNIEPERRN